MTWQNPMIFTINGAILILILLGLKFQLRTTRARYLTSPSCSVASMRVVLAAAWGCGEHHPRNLLTPKLTPE